MFLPTNFFEEPFLFLVPGKINRLISKNEEVKPLAARFVINYRSRFISMIVDLDLPHNLSYSNGKYNVRGENFRNETRVVKRIDTKYLLGILAGAAIGVLLYLVEGKSRADDAVTNGLTIGRLIGGASLIGLISNPRHVSVPHRKNIHYNRELRKQIEKLKKEIKLNLRIKNEG